MFPPVVVLTAALWAAAGTVPSVPACFRPVLGPSSEPHALVPGIPESEPPSAPDFLDDEDDSEGPDDDGQTGTPGATHAGTSGLSRPLGPQRTTGSSTVFGATPLFLAYQRLVC
jgi:hypothetical protein